ncbi:MAG: membrane protein insertion efficiency factor YidD [Saprospiraceae bacterium]
MNQIFQLLRKLYVIPIHFYKLAISPLLPSSCRYTPTCSTYTLQAIMKYGIFKGTFLGAKRILRCHPWSKHDHYDPIP